MQNRCSNLYMRMDNKLRGTTGLMCIYIVIDIGAGVACLTRQLYYTGGLRSINTSSR